MQFCGEGIPVANATNTSPVVITTGEPHGLIVGSTVFSPVRVIGVNGNLGANGAWAAGVRVTEPDTARAVRLQSGPAITRMEVRSSSRAARPS